MAIPQSSVVSGPRSGPETERVEPSTVRIGGASDPPPPLRRSSAPAPGPAAPQPFTFSAPRVPSVEVPPAADPAKANVDLSATLPVASPLMSTLLSADASTASPEPVGSPLVEPRFPSVPDAPIPAAEVPLGAALAPSEGAGPFAEATAVDRLPPEPVEPLAPTFQRTAVMAVAVAPVVVPPVLAPAVNVGTSVGPGMASPPMQPIASPVPVPFVPEPSSLAVAPIVETPVMEQARPLAVVHASVSQPEKALFGDDDDSPSPPMESSRTFVIAGIGAVALIAVLGIVLALRGSASKATAVVPAPPSTSSSAVKSPATSAPPLVSSSPPEVLASAAPSASAPSPATERAFDAAAAQATLDAVPGTQSECRKLNGPRGKWKATVTFEPTGKVSEVELEKPFNRTPSGKCVKDHLKLAEIAPFGGPAQKVTTVVPIFVAGK